jgi:WD40 repeat protein
MNETSEIMPNKVILQSVEKKVIVLLCCTFFCTVAGCGNPFVETRTHVTATSPDGKKTATGGWRGVLRGTGSPLVAFFPGKFFITVQDLNKSVVHLNCENLSNYYQKVFLLCFSNNSAKIVTVSGYESSGTLALHDVQTGRKIWAIGYGDKKIETIQFSLDDNYVLVRDWNNRYVLLDAQTGHIVKTIDKYRVERHYPGVSIMLSPDGKQYAIFDKEKSEISIYNMETEDLVRQMPVQKDVAGGIQAFPIWDNEQ